MLEPACVLVQPDMMLIDSGNGFTGISDGSIELVHIAGVTGFSGCIYTSKLGKARLPDKSLQEVLILITCLGVSRGQF